jgi:site-specific recombinase XerC
MLFNWLITGQVTTANPASAVRGPKHVVKTGKTPVLDGKAWRKLIDAIPTETVRDLRDRALIATLTYLAGCESQAPQNCLRLIMVYAISFIP